MAAAVGRLPRLRASSTRLLIVEPEQEDIAEGFGAGPGPDPADRRSRRRSARRSASAGCSSAACASGCRGSPRRCSAALIFGALHALTGDQRGAAADRLRLRPRAALREDRLDRAGDPPAHAEQLCRPARSVGFRAVIRRLAAPCSPLVRAAGAARHRGRRAAEADGARAEPGAEGDGEDQGRPPARAARRRSSARSRSPARSTPFVAGQQVEVTFYLDGKQAAQPQRRGQQGQGGDRAPSEPSIVVRERRQVRGQRQARGDRRARRRQHRAQELEGQLPGAAPGPVRRRRRRLQEGDAEDGLHRQRRPLLRRQDRRAGCSPTAKSTAWTAARGRRGPGQERLRRQGRLRGRHPDAGEHVEAPLSKQVLVFAKGDKPFAIYPISSGKSSTPTVTGHYDFIRTEPGYNSHGMYYSFYFYGGYAVHGYESVPDYPASHGCMRTFIADQPRDLRTALLRRDIFIF